MQLESTIYEVLLKLFVLYNVSDLRLLIYESEPPENQCLYNIHLINFLLKQILQNRRLKNK
jgi:hypothetical protein